MDRCQWENKFTRFQAHARGYLVREEVLLARKDFIHIVTEIDGGIDHLVWQDSVIATPHFTDTDGPLHIHKSDPAAESLVAEEVPGGRGVLLQRTEAERDEPHTCRVDREVGAAEELTDETSCDRTSLDSGVQKGPQKNHNVHRAPEDLRAHKDSLTMELIWLQQAISSRKKYLSLKTKLTTEDLRS